MTVIALLLFAILQCGFSKTMAQTAGQQQFLVLRVRFADMTGFRYDATQTKQAFDRVAAHWGKSIAYNNQANFSLTFAITPPIMLTKNTATYIDSGTDNSTWNAFVALVNDAVASAPAGLNWNNLRGVVVLFADNRPAPSCFYRGGTSSSTMQLNPPGAAQINVYVSIVGENPCNSDDQVWGRIAHEVGHNLQDGDLPPHPSNYSSNFEQMDAEYPAQSGIFEKQSGRAFGAWLPNTKYREVTPATGASTTILAEEIDPTTQPVPQAIRAYLTFGGRQVYYLVSVRRRLNGDDLDTGSAIATPTDCNATQTPTGIPDCGVLIERVVENGNPAIRDCDGTNCQSRWVQVVGNGRNGDHLWHLHDTYDSVTYGDANVAMDSINITIAERPDANHYQVIVRYDGNQAQQQPDVGLESWLQPPGSTYETTDIWIDSPVNGLATSANAPLNYRYGVQSDLHGDVVPIGNGDDPAVGMQNRIYARVRNFGSLPATNVTVFFDITDPPGVGITGSNGFKNLGLVGPAQFSALASIPPGGHVDVFLTWTPNFPLTQQQIADGKFLFHTCVRIRLSHVPGEHFFANQDGDGQQENILYFDATGSTPGTPGAPNRALVHLRNDDQASRKTFLLGMQGTPPANWSVVINNGQPVVDLNPGELRDIPIEVGQGTTEPVGARHQIRLTASSQMTLTAPGKPPHNNSRPVSGATVEVAVLRKTSLVCRVQNGRVAGELRNQDPRDQEIAPNVMVSPVSVSGERIRFVDRAVLARRDDGRFTATLSGHGTAVCLYAGSRFSTSAGSRPFNY